MSHAPQQAPAWLEPLARFGYASKGIVYGVVGVLAVQAAVLGGSTPDGSKSAVHAIAQGVFGQMLLALVAMGLFAYVTWKLAQVVFDPDDVADGKFGQVRRFGRLVSVVSYGAIAVYAAKTVVGAATGGGDTKQALVAELLQLPAGPWIVGAVGLIVVGIGVHQARRAYEASFLDHYTIDADKRPIAKRVGQAGLGARAVVFAIIGAFVVSAAVNTDPSRTQGLGGALDTLAAQPYGAFLLLTVALGLAAYGVHCGFKARYRRIPVGA